MKVSIITVVYNNAKTIKSAIDSVLSQSYNNIEYIVIDGNSNDGTQDVIKSYGDKINKYISQDDDGIYDAMNKGLSLATGDIVGILNSDDFYIDEFVIEKIVNIFKQKDTQSVFANLIYVGNNTNKITRYYNSAIFSPDKFAYGIMPAHPTFFTTKEVYDKYGNFDTDFKIAADFDILARFLYANKIKYYYLDEVLIKMRTGGVSNSIKSLWINSKEQLKACRKNNIKTNIFKILLKYPKKIVGFIKKP